MKANVNFAASVFAGMLLSVDFYDSPHRTT